MKHLPLLLLLLLCSCEKPGYKPQKTDRMISWTVGNVSKTKALINNQKELELYCTPTDIYYPTDYDSNREYGKGYAIGLYADYAIYNGINVIGGQRNIFPAGTELKFAYNTNKQNRWYYGSSAQSWRDDGGTYHIRAIYPQSLISTIVPNSTAECLVLEYNTQQHQEDLMISGNRVHTVDPITHNPSISVYADGSNNRTLAGITGNDTDGYGYDHPFDLNDPIPLFFTHNLAAVRAQFRYSYIEEEEEEEEEDVLYSCYLTNGATGGLHTTGMLIYGDKLETRPDGDTQAALEGRWKEYSWTTYQSVGEGVPFYRWGDLTKTTGIAFSQIKREGVNIVDDYSAIAYSKYDRRKYVRYENDIIAHEEEIPGTTEILMNSKLDPPFYNENDGWLLVLPQAAPTDMTIHFVTKKLGEISMKVPPVTCTAEDGSRLDFAGHKVDEHGVPISGDIYQHYYCEGHKYTYTIEVNEIDTRITLSIAPWTEIQSSAFIDIEL